MKRLLRKLTPEVKRIVEQSIYIARERQAALRKPMGKSRFAYRIRNNDPQVFHDFSPPNIHAGSIAVKMLKDVGGVGRVGEIAIVKRALYRNYLLETDSVMPLPSHEACFEHPDLMQSLDMREYMAPDCTEQDFIAASEQAKKVLERGVRINISSLAKDDWVLTKYHLSKIIAFRTGFEVSHEHILADDFFEIRACGVYKIRFNFDDKIVCDIPVTVARI